MVKQIILKMKKTIIPILIAAPLLFAACGGSEAETEVTDADSTVVETEEVEVTVTNYSVDTASSIVNWMAFNAGEIDHQGTVKALDGSFEITKTGEDMEVTAASLNIDLNSINEESEKLVGHLMSADFFDVNQFATASFSFDRHEDGMVYGTATIIDKELPVEAPVTISASEEEVTIEVGEFKLDFSALEMPFYVEDVKAPEEEQHDPNIGFTSTIVGK